MGDILPQRRQTVVDRLRRRIEHYRRHQSSCLPRYDNNVNSLLDQQHQGTLLLRQRILEAKAKKASKKGDHKNHKDTTLQNSGGLTAVQQKFKRAVDNTPSPIGTLNKNAEECERHSKLARTSSTSNQGLDQGLTHQFSVEIVQQFTSPGSTQGQQIQTNVTVTAVAGNIKTSDSPVPNSNSTATSVHTTSTSLSSIKTTASSDKISEDSAAAGDKSLNNSNNIVSHNIECKQEPELDLEQCSSTLDSSNNGVHSFSDPFSGIGLIDDSAIDESIKDLIDGFSSDDMNDFNFEKYYASLDDFKSHDDDLDKEGNPQGLNDVAKADSDNSTNQPISTQSLGTHPLSFTGATSQAGPLLFPNGGVGNPGSSSDAATISALANMTSMNAARVPSYPANLGLDFPLKESSPAAQTLKQMAEQHQNMQHQQHHLGMGLGSASHFGSDYGLGPGPQFSSGTMDFLSTASNGNFMSKSSPNSMFPFGPNPLSSMNSAMLKPDAMFRPTQRLAMNHLSHMDVHKPHSQPLQRLTGAEQKPALRHSPGPAAGTGQASSLMATTGQSPGPGTGSAATGGPNGGGGGMSISSPLSFGATKPLSHFSDPQTPVNTPSPTASMQPMPPSGQYIRGNGHQPSQPPPPSQQQQQQPSHQAPPTGSQRQPYMNMATSTRLQATQNQQMQVNQNAQQLQVSQGQHIKIGEMKGQQPVMYSFSQQQQATTNSDQYQLSATQSQTVTFGAQLPTRMGMNSSSGSPVSSMHSVPPQPNQQLGSQLPMPRPNMVHQQVFRQQMMERHKMAQMLQQQPHQQPSPQLPQSRQIPPSLSQFVQRPPPPDYGSQVGQMNPMVPTVGSQQSGMMGMISQNQMFSLNGQMHGGMSQTQISSLNAAQTNSSNSPGMTSGAPGGIGARNVVPGSTAQPGTGPPLMTSGSAQMNLGGAGSVSINGNRMNNMSMASSRLYTSSLLNDQRPPNVNIGPDGLNIGMRSMNGQDWRHRLLQSQGKFPASGPVSGQLHGPSGVGQMPVPPRTSMPSLASQRGFSQAQNMADGLQMMALQQQAQVRINMTRGASPGTVSSAGPSATGPSHQMPMMHQPSVAMSQRDPTAQNNQLLTAQLSSSVAIASGPGHLPNSSTFLPNSDSTSGDFNDFFESGGFGANDLLNSLDLDMQNGNSGVNLGL